MSRLAGRGRLAHIGRAWLWLMLLVAPVAPALEVTLTAKYNGGGSGRFENTTPPGGLCQSWGSSCREQMTVTLPITYTKTTIRTASDVRDTFFVKVPARREIEVRSDDGLDSRRMVFEWTALSQRVLGANINRHTLYQARVEGGCSSIGNVSQFRPALISFLWSIGNPTSPGACTADGGYAAAGFSQNLDVQEPSVAFQLDLPPPSRLRSGIYRGSTTYRIGPGMDFDFGNGVSGLSGDTLTVNFELDVQHAFLFEFPPGSERAVLEPRGGWQAWLGGGRVPQRLYRDLPFRVWSTGPFKVYKLCQHDSGTGCAIRDAASHQADLEVALSLPGGIQHGGGAVQRLPLPTGRAMALQFESVQPVANRPGQLHFAIESDQVRGMLANAGSTYSGLVTVVFDAEL